jgi:P27 family predicted phage terminase small subunit
MKHLDLLQDPRDVEAYTVLVVSLAEYRACIEIIHKEGRVVVTDRGGTKAHPLSPVVKQHGDTAARMMKKFGMSPGDRPDEADEYADEEQALDDLLAS